jgi:hypothetical protein
MMAPRKEINGNQQAKNSREAEAPNKGKVFIEGSERSGCGAEPEAHEERFISTELICFASEVVSANLFAL